MVYGQATLLASQTHLDKGRSAF